MKYLSIIIVALSVYRAGVVSYETIKGNVETRAMRRNMFRILRVITATIFISLHLIAFTYILIKLFFNN